MIYLVRGELTRTENLNTSVKEISAGGNVLGNNTKMSKMKDHSRIIVRVLQCVK